MLITQIELENIKSYRNIKIDLRRGTTAISGSNGSGKTTLVEAIGFALFDYLAYKHDQFIREGEKYGKVTIHLIGSDERPYVVERRCGSGARWQVNDIEADARLEQRADVLDKLHDLFGIDRERPLDSLFRDALGVPQGTFTAIFLEVPSKRKQTFDALLQIEDYKTAAEGLLNTQHVYKEQMQEQQAEIQRLTYETRALDEWREQLKQARLEDEQQKQQNAQWSQQRLHCEEQVTILNEQQTRLQHLQMRYDNSQQAHAHATTLLSDREQQLRTARSASQVVTASETGYHQHQQARDELQRLRQQAQARDALRLRQAELQGELKKIEEKANNWQHRLEEVALARQKVVELAPLVEQQLKLEKQRDEAMQRDERRKIILDEGKRLRQMLDKNVRDQETLRQQIDEIEPLVPLAEQLQAHTEALTQLRIQASERSSKRLQLQEKQIQSREKQSEREQIAERLRKAERNLEIIEEHRSEAEEMPRLKERFDELAAKKYWLEGNIEGYQKSREQSAGGQCPLLHESCLNIKQRGMASLEFYFDNLLQEDHAQLALVSQQQGTVSERMNQVKKYADALNDLGKYVERRDGLAAQLQSIAIDLSRLEHEITTLQQDLAMLDQIEQRVREAEAACNESKQADAKVRKLDGLRNRYQQFQELAQQYETDLQQRRAELKELRDSEEQLQRCEAELAVLNDPRSQSKTQQHTIAQESHFSQQLQAEQQRHTAIFEQIQQLEQQISTYNQLDTEITRQEALLQSSQSSYQNYLTNINEARLLPEREAGWRKQAAETEQAAQTLQQARQAYTAARDAFNEQELATLKDELTRLQKELAALAQKMKYHQEYINDLAQRIAQAEALYTELEAAQAEHQTLHDLHTMIDHFRRLIKEAAPYVLKAMLSDISAEANRIFGEV
ncbi:MAG: hypothetical protein J2P37_27465, partial [Ktedonobacteraceae bacterium]|nr:hypothetical protein [Ktedonobacteraceae bacterium]